MTPAARNALTIAAARGEWAAGMLRRLLEHEPREIAAALERAARVACFPGERASYLDAARELSRDGIG